MRIPEEYWRGWVKEYDGGVFMFAKVY